VDVRARFAGYGLVAAVVAVAVGDLIAAFVNPAASPLLAIGSQVIDLTPHPVKEWAIDWFGTADKAVLIGCVLAGTTALAAAAGIVSRSRPALGAGVLAAMSLVAMLIALLRHDARPADGLPALLTAPVAIAVLLWLGRMGTKEEGESPTDDGRRSMLISLSLLAFAGLLAMGASNLRRTKAPPITVALPEPAEPSPPLPRGFGREGMTPFRSSNASFYRIDTALSVPAIDHKTWTLTIDGDVARTLRYTYDDLLAMDLIERDITLACVSNEVGGDLVGGARWLGVRLDELLKPGRRSGSRPWGNADQILSTDVSGMTISTPLEVALDGRDTMIAVGMNGVPLPREHGFPARLIVPGLYGFIGATKWVSRLTLTTYDRRPAYWTRQGWATRAPIKIASRIDLPRDGAQLEAGDTIVGGIAWAHTNDGVAKIQVRVDEGRWHDAHLGPTGGADYWRQWFVRWPATSGVHRLAVRAIGADGTVQTGQRMEPFPEGATGYDSITVTVG
jgi:DMSO/TMAO reductase YedYZ molybdopterin-dependent catalytic subunit